MSSTKLAQHYTRLLTLWPKDPLRPNEFRSVLSARLNALSSPKEPTSSSTASTTAAATALPAQAELVSINALYSLAENRYSKKYPLSKRYLQPSAHEQYYTELKKELEEAPNRSWWQNWLRSWKGTLRWK